MARGLTTALILPVLWGLLAAPTATLGDPVLKEYVSKPWGFSIKHVDDWKSIPGEAGEKFIVAGWKCDWEKALSMRGDESGINAELSIVRIPVTEVTTERDKKEGDDAKNPEDDLKKKIEKAVGGSNWEKRKNPKNMEDWIEGQTEGAAKRWIEKPIKAGKLSGRLLEFGAGTSTYAIAIFRDNNIDWGVVYQANEENYKKKWRDTYLKSIATFKVFPPEGQVPTIAPATDISKLKGDEKRKAIKAGIAGSPGWFAIDTKNYVFLSNSTNKAFIQQLANEIELIREKVYTKMFPPRQAMDQICVARVLGTQADYFAYGGPPGSAGFWNPRAEELVLFDNFEGETKKNSKEMTKSVMYHEAFHQYIYYAVGKVSPHSWFNEGSGDYFAGMVINGTNVRYTMFDWRTKYLKPHLAAKKDLIPMKSLLRYPQNEYYSNGGFKYAQGWAFIYYCRQVTKDKRVRDIPDIYFKHLADNIAAFRAKTGDKKEGPGSIDVEGITIIDFDFEDQEAVERIREEAVDKAIEGVDMEKLDKDFRSWLETTL